MKWLKLVLGLLFILFAIVQMNDPDPFGWIAMYLAAAVISILAFFKKYYLPFIFGVLLAAMLWLLSLVPEVWSWIKLGMPNIVEGMKAESAYIEFTREFLGLALISASTFWHYRCARKASKTK